MSTTRNNSSFVGYAFLLFLFTGALRAEEPGTEAIQSGFRGVVFARTSEPCFLGRVPDAVITFTSEDGTIQRTIESAENGHYRIELAPGRYRVTAEHPDCETYSTGTGFFVVHGDGFQTGNFFLFAWAIAEEPGSEAIPSGFGGVVFIRASEGDFERRVPGAVITFASEDGTIERTTESGENGHYRIELAPGRYRVTAEHPDYETYSTGAGFFVVPCNGFQTGNFFLKEVRAG